MDNKEFTELFNSMDGEVEKAARSLYRSDVDRLISDTWDRMWSIKERIEAKDIHFGFLFHVMRCLVKDYSKLKRREDARLCKYAATLPVAVVDTPAPISDREAVTVDPEVMKECDKRNYRKLHDYFMQGGELIRDCGMKGPTLLGFRKRMRGLFLGIS